MNALEAALASALKAGSAITNLGLGTEVWNTLAPRRRDKPYIIFQQQAAGDDNLTPRRTVSFWYLVKGVATTLAEAGTIAAAIDTTLHNKSDLAVTGWATAFWLVRERPIRYIAPDEDGNNEAHSGGVYHVRICQE